MCVLVHCFAVRGLGWAGQGQSQARARAGAALLCLIPGLGGWGGFDRRAHVSLPPPPPFPPASSAGWRVGHTLYWVEYGLHSL